MSRRPGQRDVLYEGGPALKELIETYATMDIKAFCAKWDLAIATVRSTASRRGLLRLRLYRKDVRWDIHTAHGDPRLAYLREKVRRAKDEYDHSLEINPLSWLQKFELVMGCIGVMVICWGLVELLLKLVR